MQTNLPKSLEDVFKDLEVKVMNCTVLEDFQVLYWGKGSNMPLILQKVFMTTVGAVVGMQKNMISFELLIRISTTRMYQKTELDI